jgi:hypothetical protein
MQYNTVQYKISCRESGWAHQSGRSYTVKRSMYHAAYYITVEHGNTTASVVSPGGGLNSGGWPGSTPGMG